MWGRIRVSALKHQTSQVASHRPDALIRAVTVPSPPSRGGDYTRVTTGQEPLEATPEVCPAHLAIELKRPHSALVETCGVGTPQGPLPALPPRAGPWCWAQASLRGGASTPCTLQAGWPLGTQAVKSV